MIAETYYQKALANFKAAKIIFYNASGDEEQLNLVAYHIQQSLELAIKHIFLINGVQVQKTHDIDQLITYAKMNNIDLYLTNYLYDHSEIISNWESKTRYVIGFILEVKKVQTVINEVENYFSILSKKLRY